MFQEVRTCTADDKILGVTGGSTLRHVMFILIESGAALLPIQLIRVVVTLNYDTDAYRYTLYLIGGIHQILTVIIISVIATLFY